MFHKIMLENHQNLSLQIFLASTFNRYKNNNRHFCVNGKHLFALSVFFSFCILRSDHEYIDTCDFSVRLYSIDMSTLHICHTVYIYIITCIDITLCVVYNSIVVVSISLCAT